MDAEVIASSNDDPGIFGAIRPATAAGPRVIVLPQPIQRKSVHRNFMF